MKANLIILLLLLAIGGGAAAVIVLQLSTQTFSDEDSYSQANDHNGESGDVTPAEIDDMEPPPGEAEGETPADDAEGPEPPEDGYGGDDGEPHQQTPLDNLLNRFHEHQSKIRWMRADLTMTRFGIFSEPVETDEQKAKAGRTSRGAFLYKPGNRFALTMDYGKAENGEKELERYLAYMHVLWIIKERGEGLKAERWLIDNEKKSEILMLLQGADPRALKKTFDMRLVDLGDASEAKRLGQEGHDVKRLREKDVNFVELVYRDRVKRSEYRQIEVVINREMQIEKVKLYNAFNDEETIIWFENVEINEGAEIPDGEFRFDPEAEGVGKFDDNATLEDSSEILWRMRKTGEWVKGVRAGYSNDKYDPTFGEEDAHEASSGTLLFTPPDMFRIDIAKPKEEVIGCNGQKAYRYVKDLALATVYEIERAKEKMNMGNLEIMRKFFGQEMYTLAGDFNFRLDKVEKLDGVETYHIELTLRETDERRKGEVYDVDRIELWVELETFLCRKIRLYDLQRKKNYNEVELKETDIFNPIPAAEFEPVFPEGVEVREE